MLACSRFLRVSSCSGRFRNFSLLTMDVYTLKALSDNYMYLLVDRASKQCAAVDPVEPDKILEFVESHGLKLTSVLTTHHHWDHAGGNTALLHKWDKIGGHGSLIVYGGDSRVEKLSHSVKHDETLTLGDELLITCLSTPCHTSGHICYYVTQKNGSPDNVVFTGDTLFLGGCGRFFEGSAEQMHKALLGILARLPPSTKVYCGHEYTIKNLEFALTVEPNNQDIQNRLKESRKMCDSGQPTVPGSIREELATNPFMRVDQPEVLAHAKTHDPVEAMAVIRSEKDNF